MIKATIHLTRRTALSTQDDVISIQQCRDNVDLFSVYFKTPEIEKKRLFVATRSHVMNYIEDILSSLEHDNDPFEHVQVETAIHPVILYHTLAMDDEKIRDRILDMINMSLRTKVETA